MGTLTYSKIKEYLGLEEPAPKKGRRRSRKTNNLGKMQEMLSNRTVGVKILFVSLSIFALIFLVGLIGFGAMVIADSRELPPPGKPFSKDIAQNTNIYDRNGVLLASIHPSNLSRQWVNLSDINPTMRWAMLSAEDINFYSEPGIDVFGMARAALTDIFHRGSALEGGSTITQQLVKNTELTTDQTVQRKVKEIILTLEIERQYSKNQILESYLNQIPFGGTISGIKVAAETYFGVEPNKLDLAQSAFLAALPQAPSYYSPIYGEDPTLSDGNLASTDRAYYVLDQMLKHRSETGVTAAQVAAAKQEIKNFTFTHSYVTTKAPDFVQYVQNLLEQMYGADKVTSGGLQVYTTLDYNMQQEAEAEVNQAYCELNDGSKTQCRFYENGGVTSSAASICQSIKYHWPIRNFNGDDAGMVSIDPKSGEIMALVGSPTGGPQVDIMTSPGGVQPGSSIKPMLYLSAFKNLGMAPTTFMPDVPISIQSYNGYTFNPAYAPVNFGNAVFGLSVNGGMADIDNDLSLSLNVPAVETLYSLGLGNFVGDLKSLGYTTLTEDANSSNLSYAIGGENVEFLEHVNAYASLANEGTLYPPTAILKVTDPNGKVIYQYDPTSVGKKVFDSAYPYMVDKMLEHYKYLLQDGERFTPQLFKSGYDLAGKTGTNNTATGDQNASSLTFVGYTPDLVSGFWFGNQQQGAPLGYPTGLTPEGEYLIPYWGDYMEKVLPNFPKDQFQRPSDIVDAQVCSDTGLLYQTGKTQCNPMTAIFQKDHLPAVDNLHTQIQVCPNNTGQLATPDMISAGLAQSKVFTQYKTFSSYFQPALDAYISNTLHYQNQVPNTYCTSQQGILIGFNSPKANTTYNAGNQVSVDANIISTTGSTISSAALYFNNNQVGSLNANGSEYTGSFSIPASTSNGTYAVTIKAYDSNNNEQDSSVNINVGTPSGGTPTGGGQQSSNITFISPQNSQTVAKSPIPTVLRIQVTNIPPSNISSVYFDVYSNGTMINSSHLNATQSPANQIEWDATYTFPPESNGYTIVATVVANGQTYQKSVTVG